MAHWLGILARIQRFKRPHRVRVMLGVIVLQLVELRLQGIHINQQLGAD